MKPTTIVLFEPAEPHTLYPFSVLHPAWELRCGALRLFEKVQRQFPEATLVFHAEAERQTHRASFLERFTLPHATQPAFEGDVLVMQGNALPSLALWRSLERALEEISDDEEPSSRPLVFLHHEQPFAAWIPVSAFAKRFTSDVPPTPHQICDLRGALYDGAQTTHVEAHIITFLWDAIKWNGDAIQDDARLFSFDATEELSALQGVFALNAEQISLGRGVSLAPMIVLDARKGAVIIDDGAEIMAQSTLVGPCYVGANALLKVGTRLYENTSLGEFSKVGGELKNTILQAFANKQHDGCLGYSFLGEWVNLGAGTSVSDLKNNYSRIRVCLPASSTERRTQEVQTGQTSLGTLFGDHAKSGINTMFNTGTVVGVSANIFDGNYPAKFIPPFSWGGRKDSPVFELEKAIALARTVMARRKKTLTSHEEALLRAEFALLK